MAKAQRASQSFTSYFRGLLDRAHPRSTRPGFLYEALNVDFRGGVPNSRPGLRPFHGAAFPDPIFGKGWHVKATGAREMLVASGTGIYRCIEGGDPILISMATLPVVDQVRVHAPDVVFYTLSADRPITVIYDGINQTLKWDGTALSRLGLVEAPTPAVPVTAGGGLIEKGTRNYVQTLGSLYHESNAKVATPQTVVNTANQKNTFPSPVQGVDFDDPQVTEWSLYSTFAGGSKFLFVAEADIGQEIVANVSDSTLKGSAALPLDEFINAPPPAPATAMCEHRGTFAAVFADDQSLVRFTYFDPDYFVMEGWPANYQQPVAHGDGDTIQALISFNEWLLVFKTNSAYAIVGDTFDDYQVLPVLAAGGGKHIGIGCAAPGSVLQVENSVMFASRDGIYRIDKSATASGIIEAVRLTNAIDGLYSATRFGLGASAFFNRRTRTFGFLGRG